MKNHTQNRYRTSMHIASYVLRKEKCYFCKEALLNGNSVATRYGKEIGKGEIEITIHHKDGNSEHNEPENQALAHRRCHKAFEGMLTRREK